MERAGRRTLIRRAALAVLLWAGFWALALGVIGGLLAIPFAQSTYSGGLQPSGAAAGVIGLTVLWALRPRGWFSRNKESKRPALSPESHPALYAFVRQIAAKAGAAAPDEIHLSEGATAFIVDQRRWFGLGHRNICGLGLPLFAFLSREELASVLVHELGHRLGGDLALGPWVYRTHYAIASAVDSLADSAFFLDAPFRAYGRVFLNLSSAVSREQELSADAHAASVCGRAAAWGALDKVHRLGVLWEVYFDLDALPVIQLGVKIPLIAGFRRFVAEQGRRLEVERQLRAAQSRAPSPWDSHPPMTERLRALDGAQASTALLQPMQGCLDLLGGEAAAEDAWYAVATEPVLTPHRWEDVAGEVKLPRLLKAFQGTLLDPDRVPPSALPELLRGADDLYDRMRPPGISVLSPATKRTRAIAILGDWLAASLFARGWRPELRPGALLRLVSAEGASVMPDAVVEQLAGGALSRERYLEMSSGW